MQLNSTIATLIALFLAIAVVTVSVFAPQIGAQWVDWVTKVSLLVSLALHLPVVQTATASLFAPKQQ